ncbi:bromodomain-containing protein DDB_G0280777 [Daphnia magna]|uniref:bromodomain-containing protein DDB_G0280777 n=1 Tax=Daphnia magna TaxID=35525 RepID=UPI001E1BCF27|nr:bromodomain-containing protein DDB_G0280777 [Daphnia magna]
MKITFCCHNRRCRSQSQFQLKCQPLSLNSTSPSRPTKQPVEDAPQQVAVFFSAPAQQVVSAPAVDYLPPSAETDDSIDVDIRQETTPIDYQDVAAVPDPVPAQPEYYGESQVVDEPAYGSRITQRLPEETQPTPYRPSPEEEEEPRQPAYVYAVAEPEQPSFVQQPFVPSPVSTIDAVLWGPQEEDQQVLQEYVPVRQEQEVSAEEAQVPYEEEAPIQDGSLLLSVEQELGQEPEYQEPIRQVEPEYVQPVYQEPVQVQPQQPVEIFQVEQEEPEEPTVQIQQEEQYIEPVQIQQQPEQTYQVSQEYLPPFQVYQQQPEPEIQREQVAVQPQYEPVKVVQQQPEVAPEIVQEYVAPVQVVETIQPEVFEEVQQEYVEPVQVAQQPEQTYQIEQEYIEPVQIPEQPLVIPEERQQSYQVEQEIEKELVQVQEEPEQSYQVEQEIEKQASPTYQEPLEQQFNFQQTIADFAKKQTVDNLSSSPVLSANKQAGRGRPIRPRPIIFQRTEEDLFQQGFPEVAAPEGDDVPLDEQAAIREAIFELKKESRTG